MVLRFAKQVGIPKLTPHDLRRTRAKLYRAAGGDLEQIRLLLGHVPSKQPSSIFAWDWSCRLAKYSTFPGDRDLFQEGAPKGASLFDSAEVLGKDKRGAESPGCGRRLQKTRRMSSQVLPSNTEAAILGRILQSDEKELTPEIARYLLSMKLPAPDEQRVGELSAKARAVRERANDRCDTVSSHNQASFIPVEMFGANTSSSTQAHAAFELLANRSWFPSTKHPVDSFVRLANSLTSCAAWIRGATPRSLLPSALGG